MTQLKDYLHLYYGCDLIGLKSNQIVRLGTIDKVVLEISEKGLIKLILRPLSDMTDDEETEYTSLVDKWNFGFRRNMLGAASATKYLLSKHFDLFGLIEAGLAIDKTNLIKSPE